MDIGQARALAEKYINESIELPVGDKYVIVDVAIREVDGGWYFPYQTVRFVESGDIEYSVVGNWPIFVSKQGVCLGPRRPA